MPGGMYDEGVGQESRSQFFVPILFSIVSCKHHKPPGLVSGLIQQSRNTLPQ